MIIRAPLKVILFGEHSVVYGKPCIAMAIDKYVTVKIKKRNDSSIIIESKNFNIRIKKNINNIYDETLPYATKAVEKSFEYVDKKCGLEISIKTDAPISSGLGSSASLSVSIIYGIIKTFLEDVNKEDVAKLAYETELEIQGLASRTDTYITTFGGMYLIHRNIFERMNSELSLILFDTGIKRKTKDLVNRVKKLYDKNKEIVDEIFNCIEKIVRDAKRKIMRDEDISDLMNMNHGLLNAIGVSNEAVEHYRYKLIDFGCTGVKITGAGGGGCLIGYNRRKNYEKILYKIKNTYSNYATIIKTENIGVRS